MKKQLVNIFAVSIFFVAVLSSCTKSVDNKQVYVDSYINSIYSRTGVPIYAVIHTAYSYNKLSSVSVTGTGGAAVPLNDPAKLGLSFYTDPTDTTLYKPAVPAPDNYTYNVLYPSGAAAVYMDATVASALLPAQQLTATKSNTDIVLTWKAVANTNAYKVRVFNFDGTSTTLIYESDFLTPKDATSDLSFPFPLSNFTNYSLNSLSFEVSAFLFEQDQTTFNAVSVTTTKISSGQ